MIKKFLIVTALLCLAACGSSVKTVGMNELFTLKRADTVNVRGTALNLKMLENGTMQRETGGDRVFCKFEVKYQGIAEEKTLEVGDFTSFDEFNLRLEKVNMATDISKTSCVFSVAKTLG